MSRHADEALRLIDATDTSGPALRPEQYGEPVEPILLALVHALLDIADAVREARP